VKEMLETFAILATILGTIVAAVLGWIESGEPFAARKFVASLLHALIAGGITYLGQGVVIVALQASAPVTYLMLFLAGAGVDVLLNRTEGAISSRTASQSATPSTVSTPPPASQATPLAVRLHLKRLIWLHFRC